MNLYTPISTQSTFHMQTLGSTHTLSIKITREGEAGVVRAMWVGVLVRSRANPCICAKSYSKLSWHLEIAGPIHPITKNRLWTSGRVGNQAS